ncbi:glycosyltransferase family 2 protein [Ramlibacter solisilvae]|uniref:Glycosyltransferase n=1 Tax=Ramlibacter tataouinensis TaxID=94132 RepID=A0A127JXJ0_9BURK|nr:glycosyltransferase family 2 protein [Ramlibacter tataouinensis]AMO24609.1 glycosyltransferase [Ramlibacter tataouinensis]
MKLAIVVPCYNEEEVLPVTLKRLLGLLSQLRAQGAVDSDSMLLFVDDGSKDRTWELLREAAAADARVQALRLSRNRGHQRALLAGLREAQADAVVSIDADLQDDLGAIVQMVAAAAGGADIVYGVRCQRNSDTAFKRITAEGYYRLLAMFGVEVIFNHADFRLMSRRALEALGKFQESNLFLRGMVPQLGFMTTVVYYERHERHAGNSKYPLAKMLSLAWEGITSFSVAPLRFITLLGLSTCLLALGLGLWALGIGIFTSEAVPGWTSTVVPLAFIGGVQLLSLGVIGEYVGKIYLETKRRPAYFVSERLSPDDAT